MNMYQKVLLPIFIALSEDDAEKAHELAIRSMKVLQHIPLLLPFIGFCYQAKKNPYPVEVAGIPFPNRVGLAAGFDKQAEVLAFLQELGFGFIEIGTTTPLPQPGNSRPRLARLFEFLMLWNCMGFNSDGAEAIAEHLAKVHGRIRVRVGGSLGKQKETLLEEAAEDYIRVLAKIAEYVDYLVVNISSPNTPELRVLQTRAYLESLIRKVVLAERMRSWSGRIKRRPIFVKLDPDMNNHELAIAVEAIERGGADGIIGFNTTKTPPKGFKPTEIFFDEKGNPRGGYSGKPQFERTLEGTKFIRTLTSMPFIAVGGIWGQGKASVLYDAGADLVQIYSGLVLRGPTLITEVRGVDNRRL